MVSTVTTSTITTVTSVAIAGSLVLIGVCTLLALLIQKELTAATESRFHRALNQALNIGIVPLLVAFALIVVVKITEALQ
jgi:hypothetical protein